MANQEKITTETLRRFPFFEGFTDEELDQILSIAQERSFAAGEVIFNEGDPAENFCLLLEGKVSLEKRIQLGRHGTPRRAPVSVIGPYEVLGWSALVEPHILTLSGVCLEPCRILMIHAPRLRRWMRQNPHAGYQLLNSATKLIASRLRAATATLTYFLSIVAHELKAPLAAVENYLHVMLDGYTGPLNEKQQRMLGRCYTRITDLTEMLNNLVDLARMRPEHVQADFEPVSPVEIIQQSLEDVRMMAEQKGVQVSVDVPPTLTEIIAAPRRLRQVLTNLLANAVKFSPEGSQVWLRVVEEPELLRVEVTDEGVGIPPEDQPHIFEDFYRASNVREFSGTGLGLSIAKKIIEAHGGRIWLESPYEPGKPGTRFTFTLPRREKDRYEPSKERE